MPSLDEQLTKYLADAHSIEEQALAQLRTAPDIAGDPELSGLYREHLAETEGHEQRVRGLLAARGAKPSVTKDTVMKISGKGFLLFARLQPDTPGKLHAHSLSYEALELSSSRSRRRRCSSAARSSPTAIRSLGSTRTTSTRRAITRRRSTRACRRSAATPRR